MSELLRQLKAAMVRDAVDLSELDGVYCDPATGEGLTIPIRLNWTRAQKQRRRELQEETLELQRAYAGMKQLVKDAEAWGAEKERVDRLSDENWRHWMEWWAGIFLLEFDEVCALADALPEQHWVWLTHQATRRAEEYEAGALKKAEDAHSHISGGRGG
jgi:hypothetical protein